MISARELFRPEIRLQMEVTRWQRLVEWVTLRVNRPYERWEYRSKSGEWVGFWLHDGKVPRD